MVVVGIVVLAAVAVGVVLLSILVEWLSVFHSGHNIAMLMEFVNCNWG